MIPSYNFLQTFKIITMIYVERPTYIILLKIHLIIQLNTFYYVCTNKMVIMRTISQTNKHENIIVSHVNDIVLIISILFV